MLNDKRERGAYYGHLHEEKFKLRAVELGYEVFTSGAPYSRVDCILMLEHQLTKVQIKTASLRDGILYFETSTKTYNHETKKYSGNACYTKEEIDAYGLYAPELDQTFLVPFDVLGAKQKARLRYEDTEIVCIGCPIAHDYVF